MGFKIVTPYETTSRMERTMSITSYKRPEYLRRVLDSVSRNSHLDKYTLICMAELPNECLDIFKSVDFVRKVVCVNDKVQGCDRNTYQGIKFAFDHGSALHVYLEDDVVISPDTMDMVEWFSRLPDVDNYYCMNFFAQVLEGEPDPSRMIRESNFCALGFCLSGKSWEKWMGGQWFNNKSGWDHSVHDFIKKNKSVLSLRPEASRSMHIGREGGTYCKPDFHDKMFSRAKQYMGPAVEYRIF